MATPQAFKDYIVKFRDGERIYTEGEPGTEMYIVQTGTVEIFREVDGRRVSLAFMEKGDFFGEMSLLESSPHTDCAEARSHCDLIEINSTLFDKMIRGNIEIAVRMLRKLSLRLREAHHRLEQNANDDGALEVIATASETPASDDLEEPAPPRGPATRAVQIPAGQGARGRVTPDRPAERPDGCHAYFANEDGRELFHLVGPRAAIGRFDPVTGLKPEVDLSELDLNRSVSRHHALLSRETNGYMVTEEAGALNGTYINGKKLVSGKAAPIQDGDVLDLGMVKLVFRIA